MHGRAADMFSASHPWLLVGGERTPLKGFLLEPVTHWIAA
jgi:hypothetical protein